MTRAGMMLSSLAGAAVLGLLAVGTSNLAGAQTKKNETPVSASRFGISVDGVQQPKSKGLKSQSGKKGGANYKLQNAWPQK